MSNKNMSLNQRHKKNLKRYKEGRVTLEIARQNAIKIERIRGEAYNYTLDEINFLTVKIQDMDKAKKKSDEILKILGLL